MNQVMLTSAHDTTLTVNAYGGAVNGLDLKLINSQSPDCVLPGFWGRF